MSQVLTRQQLLKQTIKSQVRTENVFFLKLLYIEFNQHLILQNNGKKTLGTGCFLKWNIEEKNH